MLGWLGANDVEMERRKATVVKGTVRKGRLDR